MNILGSFVLILTINKMGIAIIETIIKFMIKDTPRIHENYVYHLSKFDKACLIINSCVVEPSFILLVINFSTNMHVYNKLSIITAFLTYVLDDMCYTWYHYILHKKPLYKYIHAFHHKITTPYEGYTHGIMEHPLEMIGALFIHYKCLELTNKIVELTQVSIFLHIFVKAIIAILNHMDKNIRIPSIRYSAFAHTLHHTKRKVHFGQHEYNIEFAQNVRS
jgi:sterol desaturase/sphingolipid hydroxylase (fatty acid hydroxylase superfamily)